MGSFGSACVTSTSTSCCTEESERRRWTARLASTADLSDLATSSGGITVLSTRPVEMVITPTGVASEGLFDGELLGVRVGLGVVIGLAVGTGVVIGLAVDTGVVIALGDGIGLRIGERLGVEKRDGSALGDRIGAVIGASVSSGLSSPLSFLIRLAFLTFFLFFPPFLSSSPAPPFLSAFALFCVLFAFRSRWFWT